MKMIESWRKYHFYYPFLFSIAYLIVTISYYLYFVTFKLSLAGNLAKGFVLLTSPFSPLEDLLKIYSSTTQGLLLNWVFLLAVMFFAEFVYGYSKAAKKHFKLPEHILIGILATYITSIIFLFSTGYPASGTSIVGVNLVTFAAICLILDIPYRVKRLKKTVSSGNRYLIVADSLMLVLYGLAFIGLYTLYGAYGYRLTHLVGGIIGLLMFLILLVKKNNKRVQKGSNRLS